VKTIQKIFIGFLRSILVISKTAENKNCSSNLFFKKYMLFHFLVSVFNSFSQTLPKLKMFFSLLRNVFAGF